MQRNIKTLQVVDTDDLCLDKIIPPILDERKCKMEKCITLLEPYNYGKYCHAHKHIFTVDRMNAAIDKIDAKKSKRKE